MRENPNQPERASVRFLDPNTKIDRRPLLVIFLTVVIDLLGFGIVLPFLPVYAESLGANSFMIGLLLASFSAMQFLASGHWGKLSDRIGRRPVLMVGLLGSVASYILFGVGCLLSSYTILFVSRIGAGLAGATVSITQAYIADLTTAEQRTKSLALIGLAFGIGFTLGPILGIVSLVSDPYQTVEPDSIYLSPMPGFWAAGLSVVAFVLSIFWLPESLGRARDQQGKITSGFDSPNAVRGSAKPATQKANSLNKLALLGGLMRASKRNVFAWILIAAIAVLAFGTYETTLARLAMNTFHFTQTGKNWVFVACGVVFALAQGLVVRRLATRITDRSMLAIGTLILLLGQIALCISVWLQSQFGFLATLPMIAIGYAMMTTSSNALVSKESAANEQGEMLGITQSMGALSRIIGPMFGNLLFGFQHWLPYAASGVLLLVSGAMQLKARKKQIDP